ncbi:hypothetical protein ACFOON_10680 [Novosphingobium piscinae]|uniref:Uncharacterized protein n=1 Tax=Novosphingobium piscinae TaxID=1507448 RepID=A0A7X1KRE8_9SPHN|nr:hypothetical protein [Novosphingobium piscinae]MBC2670545.1 hypothetical protein [Novosphingobium piscinae]
MSGIPPKSVGLGGDGDEICAIESVERAFGVKLDKADASKWHTAGDVFASLRQALPNEVRDHDLWPRFTEVLTEQTGVAPEAIEMASPLLSQSRLWVHVTNASAAAWISAAMVVLGLLGWALL